MLRCVGLEASEDLRRHLGCFRVRRVRATVRAASVDDDAIMELGHLQLTDAGRLVGKGLLFFIESRELYHLFLLISFLTRII